MSNFPIFGAGRYETLGATTGDGTSLTPGAGSKGSYVSLGTTSFPWAGFHVPFLNGAAVRHRMDVAATIGGTDVLLAQDVFFETASTDRLTVIPWLPVAVPAGATIKVRVQSSSNATACRVLVEGYGFDSRGTPGVPRAAAINGFTNTDPSSSVTLTGTTWTEWAEISASLAKTVVGVYVSLGGGGDNSRTMSRLLVDIGVGAAGAEQPLVTVWIAQFTGGFAGQSMMGPYWVTIPAGSRVAFRAQASAAATDTLACGLLGLEL